MSKLLIVEIQGCDVVLSEDSPLAQNKLWLNRYHVSEFDPDGFTGLAADFESSDGLSRHA